MVVFIRPLLPSKYLSLLMVLILCNAQNIYYTETCMYVCMYVCMYACMYVFVSGVIGKRRAMEAAHVHFAPIPLERAYSCFPS